MTLNDVQKNASDKHADDPVQSGQSEQNTIRILKPRANNDLIASNYVIAQDGDR